MAKTDKTHLTRRSFGALAAGAGLSAAGLILPGKASAQASATPVGVGANGLPDGGLERRVSSFQAREWRDHFSNLSGGAVLVDIGARALHFWQDGGGLYKVYPTSVPLTEDLTRTGRTSVVRKRVGPDWRPTPNMLRRNPELPEYVGPGPQNPLGTHALYLTWQYYRIHGTNDTRKIGRKSSNGCIGLYNEHIEELFAMTTVGTQVLVL